MTLTLLKKIDYFSNGNAIGFKIEFKGSACVKLVRGKIKHSTYLVLGDGTKMHVLCGQGEPFEIWR